MTAPWPAADPTWIARMPDLGYGTQLVTRHQARTTDGDPTGTPTDTVTDGWMIAPTAATEDERVSRDPSTLRLTAYGGPAELGLTATDRVWLAGEDRGKTPRWQVDGPPRRWANPMTGWDPGWEVALYRVTG